MPNGRVACKFGRERYQYRKRGQACSIPAVGTGHFGRNIVPPRGCSGILLTLFKRLGKIPVPQPEVDRAARQALPTELEPANRSHNSQSKGRGMLKTHQRIRCAFGRLAGGCWLICFVFAGIGCRSLGPNAQAGGTVGGLSGAALGAIAGAESGKSLEGAAIGAAAGSLLGGTLGNQIDRDIERDDSIRQASYAEAAARAVSVDSVAAMVGSGLSDEVIAEYIRANGTVRRLTAGDLIALKQRGVSDRVINAMQQAPLPNGANVGPPLAPYPMIVAEPGGPPPPVFFVGPRWHHHCAPGAYWHCEF